MSKVREKKTESKFYNKYSNSLLAWMFSRNEKETPNDVKKPAPKSDFFLTPQQKLYLSNGSNSLVTKPKAQNSHIQQSGMAVMATSGRGSILKGAKKNKTISPTMQDTPDKNTGVSNLPAISQPTTNKCNNVVNGSLKMNLKLSGGPSSIVVPLNASQSSQSVEVTGTRSAPVLPAVPAVLCCDKCDGKHETNNCPYYKKKRDDHPDAQKNKQIGGHSTLPGSILTNARVVRQPGDGSCLFHSMSYGLKTTNATSLRAEICRFIQNNPSLRICDTPLQDWVRWDSGGASVSDYARNMSRGSWGGGIEMACLSQLKNVNVHVYERHRLGYKRISAFDHPVSPESKPIIKVLYGGGVHYDALV